MTILLLFIGAMGSLPPGPIHTQLDRATTASRNYIDCLVGRARSAGSGRAALRAALTVAQGQCRGEERVLDDVYRFSQQSRGRPQRGVPRAELRRLVAEAQARIVAERRPLQARRSKRSAFITLVQAATKSVTNFSAPPFSA